MDLICTVYGPKRSDKPGMVPIQPNWFYESNTACTVSNQNTVAFVSSFPLCQTSPNTSEESDNPLQPTPLKAEKTIDESNEVNLTHGQYYLYVCDLNSMWSPHLVTSKSFEITTLAWDSEKADTLVFADRSGQVEVWRMKDSLLSEWECVGKSSYPSEIFLRAFFICGTRKCFVNMDNTDSHNYHEKFSFRPSSVIAQGFGQKSKMGIILVSHTGLLVCLAVPTLSTSSNAILTTKKSLDVLRGRIKNVDVSFIKDGTLLVAVSNGDPGIPIRFFDVKVGFKETPQESSLILDMQIDTYPGLFITNNKNQEDKCLGIVDVSFVNGDDTDSFLVATQHRDGGRLEIWELKKVQQSVHKMFTTGFDTSGQGALFSLSEWRYVEQFSGPVSQINCVSTPKYSYQTGRAAAVYITVAYSDGSIQILLRDNLQQIGSVDLPRSGNLSMNQSSKNFRSSVTICDMSFSSTGNALVTIDSLGQLYFYRMSPITDPGGPHVVVGLQTMFEYCIVSGFDWLDVSICVKPSQIETICQRIEEDFGKQTKVNQEYYFSRIMAMKSSLYRLVTSTEYKAADCYAQLMLHSIHGVFKNLLGSSDMKVTNDINTEKVLQVLQTKRKEDASIDVLVDGFFSSIAADFSVEPSTLNKYQHLIQWITNLSLHLLASVPEYKHRKGPGYDLINNKTNLEMIREILFIIRLWGRSNDGILPSYTKTSESFDVLAKLFSLITRLKEAGNPSNDAIIDECILLPSQVMIPPLDTSIPPRGLSYALISHNRGPLSCHFMQEPEFQYEVGDGMNRGGLYSGKFDQTSLVEGAMSTCQFVDHVRHMFLGKKPYIIKECTRCAATSLPLTSQKKALNKGWDLRFTTKCPVCLGPWKLSCLDENSAQKSNLISCI